DNLIDGIFLAIERRAHGETFNVSDGVATTYLEFYSELARRAGLPGPTTLPVAVLRPLVRLLHAAHTLGVVHDDASPETLRYLMRRNAYSIEKAQRVLGYRPRVSLAEGLAFVNRGEMARG
ncbi:MAG TPA: hypothetical protein VHM19_20480, partial [Polyangiales bacterium]|nr:hypothetical protein [Polyangiales bacterium]